MIGRFKKLIFLCTMIVLLVLILIQIGSGVKEEEIGLFSWSFSKAFKQKEKLFDMMQEIGVDSLYQEFTQDLSQEVITEFLKLAHEYSIDVYYLAGTPEWGMEESSESMMTYIQHIVAFNESLPEDIRLKGIVLDVEPYLTEEWDEDQESVINQYVEVMGRAYKKIVKNGLEAVICIPYFYDSLGYKNQLETLIKDGCDTVAVMNYYKEKEQEHISEEVKLARQYAKKIIQIYELKAPGTHGLTEKTTYYNEGLTSILESWECLKSFFNYRLFSFALHDYDALKEVINSE